MIEILEYISDSANMANEYITGDTNVWADMMHNYFHAGQIFSSSDDGGVEVFFGDSDSSVVIETKLRNEKGLVPVHLFRGDIEIGSEWLPTDFQ